MSHHTPVDINPQDLERAQAVWSGFTQIIKWTIISIAVVLALMTLAFIG